MNRSAQIAVKWLEYEAMHKDATIADFCRHELTLENEKEHRVKFAGSVVPPDLHSFLAKMIGRVSGLHSLYAGKALRACGLNNFDDFVYLINISVLDGPKKTQVIHANFNELSSGLLILSRLVRQGLIKQTASKDDKRVKRLFLTDKGIEVLAQCYAQMAVVNRFFFAEIPEQDVRSCIQLLSATEAKFAERWMMDKDRPIHELVS
ncbi:MAG: MarR family winged helix-turn-helix transcriptional regulator [Flavobacteriales bacterium]